MIKLFRSLFHRWDKEFVHIEKCNFDQACKNLLAAEQMVFKLNRELMGTRIAKEGAYNERNMVVVGLAKLAMQLGYLAGLGKHADVLGEDWDPDWRNIVFIDLPSGQVSWHFHDSEMYLFDFLPPYAGVWDGHSTSLKYNRVLNPEV